MTAVAGFAKNGTVYMAADSLGSSGGVKDEIIGSKLIKRDNFLFGYTDSFRFGDILRYNFNPPYHRSSVPITEYIVTSFIPTLRQCLEDHKYVDTTPGGESGHFLAGYQGHLFEIQSDFSILESTSNYASVGSGFLLCLGSMCTSVQHDISPKDVVINAIKAAATHNPFVGGRIDFQQL